MFLILLSICVFLLPGFMLIKIGKLNTSSIIDTLFLSYILSMALSLGLLYIGGILGAFSMSSGILAALVIISLIFYAVMIAKNVESFQKTLIFFCKSAFSKSNFPAIIAVLGLFSIYVIFLFSGEILDSDVIQYYLPMARQITGNNSFTHGTGYDYNIFLRPIAGSVLYAWTYSIGDSLFSEAFRAMPFIPILVLILANYSIAKLVTDSSPIGILSTLILIVLPFHDRFLLYNAFYPDIFYYPLSFIVIYFSLKYVKNPRNSLLLWIGTALGVASLIKAQTLFFAITVLVIIIVTRWNSKKLSLVICFSTPFLVLIPNILVESIQQMQFQLQTIVFNYIEIVSLILLACLCSLAYLFMSRGETIKKINILKHRDIAKIFVALLVPFFAFSSLWYFYNLSQFGTLLYTSSIQLPNYEWALSIEKSLESTSSAINMHHYLTYFLLLPVDPSVLGYVWIFPLLIGLAEVVRNKNKNLKILIFFTTILTALTLSNLAYSIPHVEAAVYNPRDLLPLAPMLSLLSAIGVKSILSWSSEKKTHISTTEVSLFIIAYFGLFCNVHSVLLWFTDMSFSTPFIGHLLRVVLYISHLTFRQTSFQLTATDRIMFASQNIWGILALSLFVGLPFLLVALFSRYKFWRIFKGNSIGKARKKSEKILDNLAQKRTRALYALGIIFLLAVIMIPRIEIFILQGNFQKIRSNQLEVMYGSLYEMIESKEELLIGNLLTFGAPMGLPYFLSEIKIVDLKYPANLGFLKDTLLCDSGYAAVTELRQLGFRHILLNPQIAEPLDEQLNFTLSRIIRDPELAILAETFESWRLYDIGPYQVERTIIDLDEWSVDQRYTNSPYTFNTTDSCIQLGLNPTSQDSKVTIVSYNVPKLNLSDFDYIVTNLEGSSNARIDIRFILDNGESFDVAYWKDPYTYVTSPFHLVEYQTKTLRGDAFIGLKSSNVTDSLIKIFRIEFIKIIGD